MAGEQNCPECVPGGLHLVGCPRSPRATQPLGSLSPDTLLERAAAQVRAGNLEEARERAEAALKHLDLLLLSTSAQGDAELPEARAEAS